MAGLFSLLDPLVFALAFALGLMITYATVPKPEVVIKFPTSSNAGKIVYKGGRGCYKYRAEEIPCPLDSAGSDLVRMQPL